MSKNLYKVIPIVMILIMIAAAIGAIIVDKNEKIRAFEEKVIKLNNDNIKMTKHNEAIIEANSRLLQEKELLKEIESDLRALIKKKNSEIISLVELNAHLEAINLELTTTIEDLLIIGDSLYKQTYSFKSTKDNLRIDGQTIVTYKRLPYPLSAKTEITKLSIPNINLQFSHIYDKDNLSYSVLVKSNNEYLKLDSLSSSYNFKEYERPIQKHYGYMLGGGVFTDFQNETGLALGILGYYRRIGISLQGASNETLSGLLWLKI